VGLFRNQPGDALLAESDLVVTVVFDPVEYDPEVWNEEHTKRIFSIDGAATTLGTCYAPQIELVGTIDATFDALAMHLGHCDEIAYSDVVMGLRAEPTAVIDRGASRGAFPFRPLHIAHDVRQTADTRNTTCCDVGSFYMWVARIHIIHEPRRLLFSNGEQTLGVALPWAIAASIVRPGRACDLHVRRRQLPVQRHGARDGAPPRLPLRAHHLGLRRVRHGGRAGGDEIRRPERHRAGGDRHPVLRSRVRRPRAPARRCRRATARDSGGAGSRPHHHHRRTGGLLGESQAFRHRPLARIALVGLPPVVRATMWIGKVIKDDLRR
jgi:hypothetical protein